MSLSTIDFCPLPEVLPSLKIHPVHSSKVLIGSTEVRVLHCPETGTAFARVHHIHKSQAGSVFVAAAVTYSAADEGWAFIFPYQYVAIKSEKKEKIREQQERMELCYDGDNTMVDKALMRLLSDSAGAEASRRSSPLPHLPKLHELWHDASNFYSVMEYFPQDLRKVIDEEGGGGGLSEERTRGLIRGVLLALRNLHALGWCHRDISPENIMVRGGGPSSSAPSTEGSAQASAAAASLGEAVLIDFGTAKLMPRASLEDGRYVEGRFGREGFSPRASGREDAAPEAEAFSVFRPPPQEMQSNLVAALGSSPASSASSAASSSASSFSVAASAQHAASDDSAMASSHTTTSISSIDTEASEGAIRRSSAASLHAASSSSSSSLMLSASPSRKMSSISIIHAASFQSIPSFAAAPTASYSSSSSNAFSNSSSASSAAVSASPVAAAYFDANDFTKKTPPQRPPTSPSGGGARLLSFGDLCEAMQTAGPPPPLDLSELPDELGGYLSFEAPPRMGIFCKPAYAEPRYVVGEKPYYGIAFDLWSIAQTLFACVDGTALYKMPFPRVDAHFRAIDASEQKLARVEYAATIANRAMTGASTNWSPAAAASLPSSSSSFSSSTLWNSNVRSGGGGEVSPAAAATAAAAAAAAAAASGNLHESSIFTPSIRSLTPGGGPTLPHSTVLATPLGRLLEQRSRERKKHGLAPFSPSFIDLLLRLWRLRPDFRCLNVGAILNHPWFAGAASPYLGASIMPPALLLPPSGQAELTVEAAAAGLEASALAQAAARAWGLGGASASPAASFFTPFFSPSRSGGTSTGGSTSSSATSLSTSSGVSSTSSSVSSTPPSSSQVPSSPSSMHRMVTDDSTKES